MSRPFAVDNHKPVIEGLTALEGRVPQIRGLARDNATALTRVEVSVDGGPWMPVAPSDGVFDSLREAFSFTLPDLAPGDHRVRVRGFDGAGNSGVAETAFKVS